jgi:hypothetical protein
MRELRFVTSPEMGSEGDGAIFNDGKNYCLFYWLSSVSLVMNIAESGSTTGFVAMSI